MMLVLWCFLAFKKLKMEKSNQYDLTSFFLLCSSEVNSYGFGTAQENTERIFIFGSTNPLKWVNQKSLISSKALAAIITTEAPAKHSHWQ